MKVLGQKRVGLGFLSLAVALSLLSFAACQVPTDWNYDLNGTDWTQGNCSLPDSSKWYQSPFNINRTARTKDFYAYSFSFIPNYGPAKTNFSDVFNFTYQQTGAFGMSLISDLYPFASS